ncbi:AAA family ATPase [Bradyrhizobium diazoefficiens]
MFGFGKSPKRAIVFRTDDPFSKITANLFAPNGDTHKIEFLADGQQVVVDGVHPDTGKPYSWHGDPLYDVKRDYLPSIGEELARELVDAIVAMLCRDFGYRRTKDAQAKRDGGTKANGQDGEAAAGWDELFTNIRDGNAYHDSHVTLANKLAKAGTEAGTIVNLIRALMDASPAPHDQRWSARYDDIHRIVNDAVKFQQLQQAKAAPPFKIAFIDVTKWHGQPVPERLWAVRDRIPSRQVTLFSGEGGVGKSILLLQALVAAPIGRDWIGSLPEPGPALYLGAEDETDELHRRLAKIVEHYGVSLADMADLHPISLAGMDATLARFDRLGRMEPTPLFNALYEQACDIKPVLIGLDTVSDIFSGNENDRAQVSAFVGLLRGLAMASNSAVIVNSHPSLSGIAKGTGTSGSTGWHNRVRSRMYFRSVTDEKGEDVDPDLRVLEFMKNQYGPLAESVMLRWRNGVFIPEPRTGSYEQKLAESRAEQLFLTLLDRFTRENRKVSHASGKTYAPNLFSVEQEAADARLSKEALAGAMRRLLAAKKVHVESYGPPSKNNQHLVPGAGT